MNHRLVSHTSKKMLLLLILFIPVINAQQKPRLCGTMRSHFSPYSRIVGGTTAAEYAWPWQVYITLKGMFVCGGTLIDPQHIITGAHCVVGKSNNTNDILVRIGAQNMIREGHYSGKLYRISAKFVHDKYMAPEYGNDLAILRLQYSVNMTDTVNNVCLPNSVDYNIAMYQYVVITGFGLVSERGYLPYRLQQAVVNVLPTCPYVYKWFNGTNQICAGLFGGGRDTCQGKN